MWARLSHWVEYWVFISMTSSQTTSVRFGSSLAYDQQKPCTPWLAPSRSVPYSDASSTGTSLRRLMSEPAVAALFSAALMTIRRGR